MPPSTSTPPVPTLEHPRLAARLAEIAGKPIELFNRALPETASKAITVATPQALNRPC
jgi:hypothetical protein